MVFPVKLKFKEPPERRRVEIGLFNLPGVQRLSVHHGQFHEGPGIPVLHTEPEGLIRDLLERTGTKVCGEVLIARIPKKGKGIDIRGKTDAHYTLVSQTEARHPSGAAEKFVPPRIGGHAAQFITCPVGIPHVVQCALAHFAAQGPPKVDPGHQIISEHVRIKAG